MTFSPEYVPIHLRGKVSDFRQEPDGRVSFSHPEAALGLGPEFSRKTLSRGDYDSTFDRSSRYANIESAFKNQYGGPSLGAASDPIAKIRDTLAGWLRNAAEWGTSSTGKAIGMSALVGAGLGAGAGAMHAGRTGKPMLDRSVLAALAGAGLASGGMALLRDRYAARQSSFAEKSAASVLGSIDRALTADMRLTQEERHTLRRLVAELSRYDQSRLEGMLRVAAGAGAGALVARFLSNKGLLPMAIGGIVGALVAAATGGPRKNSVGQYVF